jgi:hypothetical protein
MPFHRVHDLLPSSVAHRYIQESPIVMARRGLCSSGSWWLRVDLPLVSLSGDLDGEAPVTERGDDQAATRVGSIRLGMAWPTESPPLD